MKKVLYKMVGLGLNLWSFVDLKGAAAHAYRIFGRTPKPVLRQKELDFIQTARQERHAIGAIDVVEYHWGPEDGPLIVLSYGWGYNAGRWRHFVPALEIAGFHVVAYDPPGHGLNEGTFLNLAANSIIVRDLIERYGPAEAIIAHSFGGASSVLAVNNLAAELRPKRMVVMASFSSGVKVFSGYRHLLGLRLALYRALNEHIEAQTGTPPQGFDPAQLSARFVHTKGLLVHDPEDKVTPFFHIERYHAFWPGSVLWAVPGAGHHLGTTEVTSGILAFTEHGILPKQTKVAGLTLDINHDLVRYFVGMEAF